LVASKKGNVNLITLGTDGVVPQGYTSVVYLDKPLSIIETDARVYVNTEIDGFDTTGLHADRVALGKVYMTVKNHPQGFLSAVEIAEECGENVRQVVFALRVFIELGLIIPQAGRYKAVVGIKRDLADSSVYRLIKRILG
jgi:ssDNA-specific exonuclease RecJ